MSWGGPYSGWPTGWGGTNPIIRRVGSTRLFSSIQEAVDDVEDGWAGSTFTAPQLIVVDPETFTETVTIPDTFQPTTDFPLIIQADNGHPVLDAGGGSVAITVQADWVQVSDLDIINAADTGVSVTGDSPWLNGLSIEADTGIVVFSSDSAVTNNQIHASKTGIKLDIATGANLVYFNSVYVQGTSTLGGVGINMVESPGEVRMNVVKAQADSQDVWAISVEDSSNPTPTLDDNVYHTIDSATHTAYVGRHPGGTQVNNKTLSEWQTEIGDEAGSLEAEPEWGNVPVDGTVSAASAGSNEVTITDANKDFSEDELRSHLIEFLDGPLAGSQFVVRTNSGSDFVLQETTSSPDVGDKYRIVWEDGTKNLNARPRIQSPLFDGIGSPVALTDNDRDKNIRDGVTPTPGCYEAKHVAISDEVPLILEIISGLSGPLDTVYGGRGGALSRFVPGDKLITDSGLNDQVVVAPVSQAFSVGNKVNIVMALGIDQLFPDQLLDGTIDYLDEVALGTSEGRLLFLRADQEIPLDPLTQVTTEITMQLDVVRV